MTVVELVDKLREMSASYDVSNYEGFLAIQVNITGENEGVFYVEIKDGKLSIEPYDYHDRNASITISMDNFLKLINGKLDPVMAFTLKKVIVDGDAGKALELTKLFQK